MMRRVGKYAMLASALPVVLAAACAIAFLGMAVYGEPTRNAGFVPLIVLSALIKPATYAPLPFMIGFALWCAGVARREAPVGFLRTVGVRNRH